MTAGTLLLRADAGTQIGSGHVMRLLALAQAWQDRGGQAVLVGSVGEGLGDRLRRADIAVEAAAGPVGGADDAAATSDLARRLGAVWVVADGYRFGTPYQQALVDGGARLLVLDDDGHADAYPAHVVLNQNVSADPALYARRAPHTRLLIGADYALLRREFTAAPPLHDLPPARSVLVTLGGGDADNATATVVDGLAATGRPDLDVTVVAGGANPHRADLERRLDGAPFSGRLLHGVDDMAGLMRRAGLAVSAGGSTCWELAYVGVPSAVVVLAENQRSIAAALDGRGAAVSLGAHDRLTPAAVAAAVGGLLDADGTRQRMSARSRALVDGQGAGRVVEALAEYA